MIYPTAAGMVILAQYTMLPPTMVPPQRYDHPFHGKVIVHEIDACKGCSGFTRGAHDGICEIYVLKTGNWIEDVIKRHEIAHCNGWPADHPR